MPARNDGRHVARPADEGRLEVGHQDRASGGEGVEAGPFAETELDLFETPAVLVGGACYRLEPAIGHQGNRYPGQA